MNDFTTQKTKIIKNKLISELNLWFKTMNQRDSNSFPSPNILRPEPRWDGYAAAWPPRDNIPLSILWPDISQGKWGCGIQGSFMNGYPKRLHSPETLLKYKY